MLRGRRLLLSRRSVCYLSEESAVGTGRDTCRGRGTSDAHRGLEQTLSNGLQLAPQKGVYADELDAELERLYAEHVAPPRKFSRRCSRQPCNDSQLLLASLESGWTLETHPEVDGRSG